jgi:outer membrane beta-barrel protein
MVNHMERRAFLSMKLVISCILAGCAALVLLPGRGLADESGRVVTVTPLVGVFIPASVNSDLKTGLLAGVRGETPVTEDFSVEGDVGFLTAKRGGGDAKACLFGLQLVYPVFVRRELVPFVDIGFGGILFDRGASGPTLNLGAGASYFLTEHLAVRGEVRDVAILRSADNNVEITVGLSYRFGGGGKERAGGSPPMPEPEEFRTGRTVPGSGGSVPVPAGAPSSPAAGREVVPPGQGAPPIPAAAATAPPELKGLKGTSGMATPSGVGRTAPTAPAGVRAGAITISPFVGGYTFDGSQHLQTNVSAGLGLGYNLSRHWGVEGRFSWVPLKSTRGEIPGEYSLFNFHGDLLYHFIPEGRFVPYVALGAGVSRTEWSTYTNNDALLVYGGGVKYFLTDWLALRGDVRQIFSFHADNPGGESYWNNFEYAVGLSFSFGGGKPTESPVNPEKISEPGRI